MSSSEPQGRASADPATIDDAAATALEIAERAIDEGTTEAISEETVQRLLTAGARLFACKVEMEDRYFVPFDAPLTVTATDVVVTVSEMLRAANLNTFDLAMWFRRPRSNDPT